MPALGLPVSILPAALGTAARLSEGLPILGSWQEALLPWVPPLGVFQVHPCCSVSGLCSFYSQ